MSREPFFFIKNNFSLSLKLLRTFNQNKTVGQNYTERRLRVSTLRAHSSRAFRRGILLYYDIN